MTRPVRDARSSTRTATRSAALALLACGLLLSCAPKAAPVGGEVGDHVERALAEGERSFDHDAWNRLLADTVTDGFIDYAAVGARRGELDGYLGRIAAAKLYELSRDELLALLINAYNAYTVASILDHPGVTSIREIDGVWKERRHPVGGFELTLDEVEHGLIRPYFQDPRIHFAVNCASWSCPPLPPWAFVGERLDDQLEESARSFFANPENAVVRDGKLWLSRILDWYGGDFTAEGAEPRADTLGRFVARYAPENVGAFVEEQAGEPPIEFFEYDWSLNDAARLRPGS